ncbi:DUF1217 domain-containing protein [Aestuariispira ectoiniformans]|uniref:DUF1217 domain-containing protein n=1 Tax=Aestuariispira ectoiniformans TaxID=2775080 RepID=UPI00223B5174|nr:DUF1217 domain-containing protein [Aestuariispira ectoiniformans]
MNVTMPSLAVLLGGQNQSPLFNSLNNKPAISAKLAHDSLATQKDEKQSAIATAGKVERDMAAFKRAVGNATTLEEALSDPTVHRMLSQVYEIDILSNNSERFAQIVSTNPDDPTSLAARSRDKGMIALAEDLQRVDNGLGLLQDETFQNAIQDTVVSVEFEAKAADVNPAAANAFYFERNAAGLETPMDVLSNSRIRDVVFGALDLPDSYKSQPIAKQAAVLAEKLDFTKMQDPDYIKELSVNYLNTIDRQQPVGKPSLATILQPSGTGALFNTLA